MTEQYMISVDAGGTKTKACAYDKTGRQLCCKVTEFGNLSLDYDLAHEHIKKAIIGCMHQLKGRCCFICIGAAGIETGTHKIRIRKDLEEELGLNVYATNDAVLALYSALQGRDGVLVISGTGAISSCKWQGDISRVGGWGHLINDDGSGYSIGAKAIRRITDNYDTDQLGTALEKAMFSHLGITSLRELISYVYSHQKSDIAALVPVVERLAENGDAQSANILIWAGERLAEMVFRICARHKINQPLIAVSGSVITKTRMTRVAFEQAVRSRFPQYEIVTCQDDPAKGGYYIWLEQTAGK